MQNRRWVAGLIFMVLAFGALAFSVSAQDSTATAEATPDVLATAAPPATETAEVTAAATEVATLAPTVAPTASEFITYTVERGDNLYKISVKFNTTMDRIAADNGITNPQLMYAGQQLKIRNPQAQGVPTSAPTAVPTSAASTPVPQQTYVVTFGDTLARIATRFHITQSALMQANNITNPNLVYVGQTLIIPGNATPTPVPTPTESVPEMTLEAQAATMNTSFGYGLEVFAAADNAASVAQVASQIGMNWVKLEVDWRDYEAVQGQISFATLDPIVEALAAQKLNILFTVTTSPDWARTSRDEEGPPDDFGTYANFVGQLAAHFNGKVQAYEIWDEPNLRREWNSNLHAISPSSYIELLRQAYATIKAANPQNIVVSAGLSPTGFNDGVNAINDRIFLDGLYANGVGNVTDAIGAHPGGWANPPDSLCCAASAGVSTHFEDKSFYFLNTLGDYRAIMTQNGNATKPIWVTKFGWGTSEDTAAPSSINVFITYTSLAEQAIYDPRGFEIGQQLGYIGPMFLNNLNGCQARPNDAELCYYSLIGPNGSPRPVYTAVQALDKTAPNAAPESTEPAMTAMPFAATAEATIDATVVPSAPTVESSG